MGTLKTKKKKKKLNAKTMVTLYCSLIVEEFNGAYACVIVQKI